MLVRNIGSDEPFEKRLLNVPENELADMLLDFVDIENISSDEIAAQHHFYVGTYTWRSPHGRLSDYSPYVMIKEGAYHTFSARKFAFKWLSLVRSESEFTKNVIKIHSLMDNDLSWFDFLKHCPVHAATDISKTLNLKE